jgi:shikimate kinase
MIKLKELMGLVNLNESSYDKGLFKAIFFSGIPGSGKSYTIGKITAGDISPRIVNTDKYIEFLTKKFGVDVNSDEYYSKFKEKIYTLNKSQLTLYINDMLPLFIDGTSNNIESVFRREGILKSFGYDVGMVWINTDLNQAIDRAQRRDRKTPVEFIKKVHDSLEENMKYYKNHFKFFIEIKNSEGELTDSVINSAFKSTVNFFTSPVENPIGKNNLNTASKTSGRLVPNVKPSLSNISNLLGGWYSSGI